MARFYSSGAPRWWPYHVVTPNRSYSARHVILDNGMWSFWKKQWRPPVDVWIARLWRVAHYLKSEEVIVVLPDWLGDPRFTLEAARDPIAARLCRDYKCMAVAHSYNGMEGFYRSTIDLASIDYLSCIAAPLKLPCKGNRRVPSTKCQTRITGQIARAARASGLRCIHGLGVLLRPSHVRALVNLGLSSFDSTSWTRPNSTTLKKSYPYSAKNTSLKDLFFRITVKRLLEAGVPLELPAPLSHEGFLEALEVVL